MRTRRVSSIQNALLAKSKEAALNAVSTYNNPLALFKSENFIVLMVIAWANLLHAYYRCKGVDYRYFDLLPSGRKRYLRISKKGGYKYWELERCLRDAACPLDEAMKANLRFLIGLRNEIEHHICLSLDERMSGRYFAACLNYESVITALFGSKHSVGDQLSLALQFRDLFRPVPPEAQGALPATVAKYIQEFDASISDEIFASQAYAVRLLFTKKTANRKGQADRVLEFVEPGTGLAEAIEKEYWVLKEMERPKLLARQVLSRIKDLGYPRFGIQHHTRLWQRLDAKNPAHGYCVQLGGIWFWYERWVARIEEECRASPDLYGPIPGVEVAT